MCCAINTNKNPQEGSGEAQEYEGIASAFYDFVQISVHGVQTSVRTRRLAHGPFQLAVH